MPCSDGDILRWRGLAARQPTHAQERSFRVHSIQRKDAARRRRMWPLTAATLVAAVAACSPATSTAPSRLAAPASTDSSAPPSSLADTSSAPLALATGTGARLIFGSGVGASFYAYDVDRRHGVKVTLP